jgi:outer membrane protein
MKRICFGAFVVWACLAGAAVILGAPGGATGATSSGALTPSDTLYLSVADAVHYALRDGVEAAIVRQDVRAAEAQVGVALSYALPSIDFGATYTRNLKKPVIFFEIEGEVQSFSIGEDNAYNAGLNLRQTLWASGRVSSGYKMAKERAVAAGMAGDDAAATIAREVRASYYLALLAGRQVEIARRSLDQAEQNVAQIAARVERGVSPEFERLRAQVTVANRKPILTRTMNGEAVALESLKRLIGVPLDRPLALLDGLVYIPFEQTQEEMVERALAERRDLAAARSEAIASEHQYHAQAANDLPLVYLDGNLAWQGQTSNGMWPGDKEQAQSASVGLTFAWPLLDGFRNKNETRIAEAAMERARLRVTQAEDVIRLEVRSNWADVSSIALEIDGAQQAVDVAREAYAIAQVRYQTGVSTLVELLDAEVALIETEVNLSGTLYRYNVALAQLEYSVGEGPMLETKNGE